MFEITDKNYSDVLTSCLLCRCWSKAALTTCLAAGGEVERSNVAPWNAAAPLYIINAIHFFQDMLCDQCQAL